MITDKILVTGGTGQVGKHLQEILPNATYLSSTDCDLRVKEQVYSLFKEFKPTTVIHLAAKVGGISENVSKPADYFTDNIMMNTNLVEASKDFGINQFIALLSTCIFPDVLPLDHYPMKEQMMHLGPPTKTNFSYGYAKRCMAVHIDAVNKQYGTRFQYLIPSNLYGPYDKYNERSHFVGALLKKIKEAKDSGKNEIVLMGDGTPLRQFTYAGDLAQVIKLCYDSGIRENFNVTTSENLSIKQIAEIALKVCDAENLKIVWTGEMSGQARKDVSGYWLSRSFPSFAFTKLETGLKKTWDILLTKTTIDA